ncbi:entry exclusion lipoprotein TrbK [Duganella sp. BuS-21]|uniref:entry exclusion lipoprotein TrbK n=1 Tax=Duganella sp. BuS-21 TaxID=2943848 RepID=UPI0035A71098
MSNQKNYKQRMILLFVFLLSGCDWLWGEPPLPEVTAENCKPENVKRIRNEEARNKFLSNCALRSTIKPSRPRGW